MNDGPKRPRFPRPAPPPYTEPEVTRVEEDPIPLTERVPTPPMPLPREPFKRLDGRQPSYVEFSAQLTGFSAQLAGVASRQDKMALQLDHHGQIINERANVLHTELALMRHDIAELLSIVTTDHGPRLDKVESTLGQKVAKHGGILAIAVVALPMLAEALPKYKHLIDTIVGALQ